MVLYPHLRVAVRLLLVFCARMYAVSLSPLRPSVVSSSLHTALVPAQRFQRGPTVTHSLPILMLRPPWLVSSAPLLQLPLAALPQHWLMPAAVSVVLAAEEAELLVGSGARAMVSRRTIAMVTMVVLQAAVLLQVAGRHRAAPFQLPPEGGGYGKLVPLHA